MNIVNAFLARIKQQPIRPPSTGSAMFFSTQVLKCDPASISFDRDSEPHITSPQTLESLQAASRHLLETLQPVAFPTETVYGLAAPALDAEASARIFSTKGRPADNPLIVHVSSESMLQSLLPPNYTLLDSYQILIKRFWPGPLTLLFPSDPTKIPSIITANHPTVAIRMPSHPVARALIAISNSPLAAPSANSSGKPSPTRAEHVFRDLGGKIGLILDGGPCDVGLESTVVDGLHQDGNIRILRPGGVTVEEIEKALQQGLRGDPIPRVLVHRRDFTDDAIEQAPTTPGMKYRHYSPAVPVTLLRTVSTPPAGVETSTPSILLSSIKSTIISRSPLKVGLLTPLESIVAKKLLEDPVIQWHQYVLGPLSEPAVIAQRLFDGLLTLEAEGVDIILVEEVPEGNEGLAIMNRVQKAAGETCWVNLQSS
ncbi:translation factor [Paxillus ammoniavirescens]|nr:translation factor [Paxillus ammoniavirescens]